MPERVGMIRRVPVAVKIPDADADHADAVLRARKVSGRPKRCKLAHAFLWECSYKRLKTAQLLGQLGVSLTWAA